MRTLSALFTLLLSTTAFASQPWQLVEFGALDPSGTTTLKFEDFLLDGARDHVPQALWNVSGVGIGVFGPSILEKAVGPGESITLTFAPIPAHSLSLKLVPVLSGTAIIQ